MAEERGALGDQARLGQIACNAIDLAAGTEYERNPLVKALRFDIEDPVERIACSTTGLFDQEGDGVGFIDEPQTPIAIAFAGVARIKIDAATDENAIAFGDHRRDPAHVEILLARSVGALQAIVHVEAHALVPVPVVRHVDGEFLRPGWYLRHARRKEKCAARGRVDEYARTAAERQRQRQLRPIDE